VAAFHLDKLESAGLLASRFERVSGRTGPGAGRPAKLYRRADAEIALSLPPRSYDLAGAMLADAVSRAGADGTPVAEALSEAARGRGEQVAQEATAASLMTLLREHGFEPRADGSSIALVNCPFHALAAEHTALVCGMNLDFLTGVISGLGAHANLTARLAPSPGHCCVRIERT
jgi:predicted ArsR family transcriptional regulator